MAKPIPRNRSSTRAGIPHRSPLRTNSGILRRHHSDRPIGRRPIQPHQAQDARWLARLFARIGFAWRWVLLVLSGLVGASTSWYALAGLTSTVSPEQHGSILAAAGVGLALVISVPYVILQSAGLRHLESISTRAQLVALFDLTIGAVTLTAILTAIVLVLLVVGLVAVLLRPLAYTGHSAGN